MLGDNFKIGNQQVDKMLLNGVVVYESFTFSPAATFPDTASLSTGLVGYWEMDGVGTGSLYDSTSTGNDLSVAGWGSGSGIGSGVGALRTAQSGAMEMATPSTMITGASFTVGLWIKISIAISQSTRLFEGQTYPDGGFNLRIHSAGQPRMILESKPSGGGNGTVKKTTVDDLPSSDVGLWVYLMAAMNTQTGETIFKKNDVEQAHYTIDSHSHLTGTPNTLAIGSHPLAYQGVNNGTLIDRVAVWDRYLSPAEMTAAFTDGTTHLG